MMRFCGRAYDATTLSNWHEKLHDEIVASDPVTVGAPGKVVAVLFAKKEAYKVVRSRRPRSKGQNAGEQVMRELIKAVYGEHPGRFATGTWTGAASDILRDHPKILSSQIQMQALTGKVVRVLNVYLLQRVLNPRSSPCHSHVR